MKLGQFLTGLSVVTNRLFSWFYLYKYNWFHGAPAPHHDTKKHSPSKSNLCFLIVVVSYNLYFLGKSVSVFDLCHHFLKFH